MKELKELKNAYKPRLSFMKKLIICLLITVLIYTVASFWLAYKVGMELTSLTIALFGLIAGEFSILGYLKGKERDNEDTYH